MTSVARALRIRAGEHPEKTAIICGARSVSYGELWTRVVSTAALLEARGVGPGDRVELVANSTSPTFVFGYLGAHLVGAVAVPVDPAAPALRHEQIAAFSGARLVVGAEAGSGADLGALSLDEIEALPPSSRTFADPDENALADLLFTTGTGGLRKGVKLTHGSVVAAATHINATLGNGDGDVEVVPLPLSHSFGLGRLRCNLLSGGALVLTQGFKLPGEIFGALKRHGATGLAGVPVGFRRRAFVISHAHDVDIEIAVAVVVGDDGHAGPATRCNSSVPCYIDEAPAILVEEESFTVDP
jgi:long-chain acyl-CoA synthetase